MLRSTKQMYGDKLRAKDGEIGHIKDFYFDDQSWVVRYLIADTGEWLAGRMVLISPHVLTNFDLDGVCRVVNLTRMQIETSPPISSHMPVSRQYEEEYLRSTQAVTGYHIQTREDSIGHITDFIIDEKDWAICHLVVETGHWYSGKQIVISPRQIERISYAESKVFVSVTKEALLKIPKYHASPWAYEDTLNTAP
jgi:uncharacterized protein YrrD